MKTAHTILYTYNEKIEMSTFSRFAQRLPMLVEVMGRPSLLLARFRGVSVKAIMTLDKPWIHSLGISHILDIGANTGQFASAIRYILPSAHICSFEPLPECFKLLQKKMAADTKFSCHNKGLGDLPGKIIFKQNKFSQSSSFLTMAKLHTSNFPFADQSKDVIVEVSRLDDMADELAIQGPLMVKIDVQGYEDKVLAGGSKIISSASVIFIESSFETLYEGQPLFSDIHHILTSWGFLYYGNLEQIESTDNGKPLWEDSIYIRR